MYRRPRALLAISVLLLATAPASRVSQIALAHSDQASKSPASPTALLKLSVQPPKVQVGRDVSLQIRITDATGKPVTRVLVTIMGAGRPGAGTASSGTLVFAVHAASLGTIVVQATHAGFAPATVKLPIISGSPATVVAIKSGLRVLAPHAKPQSGKVGTDLFDLYHGVTAKSQYASLALRDGTLMDLNASTDVVIHDPLHTTLTNGELFLEVVHGAASHQIQVGNAVAATKGTRLDVKGNSKTKTWVVTVIEGQVQVTNVKVKGAPSTILVGSGQQSTVVGNRPPSPPAQVNVSKVIVWVKNVPNTNATTVPPVLNLPLPQYVPPVVAPPAASSPAITITGTLSTSTWTAGDGPYLLNGGVTVPAGAALTIAPGTTVEMGPYAYLDVLGTLTARGTDATPIIFTSAAAQPKPGDWQYIRFDGARAVRSVFDHVQVFYGSSNGGASGMLSLTGGANLTISNDVFSQASTLGLWIDDTTRPTVTNCVFAGNGSYAIEAPVDDLGLITGIGYGPGQTGMRVRGGTVSHDATWQRPDVPVQLLDATTIATGVTVTIAPGTTVEMGPYAYLDVLGTLTARGTDATPIIFTSAAAQPKPGDWQYIRFDGARAVRSVFDHVQVFYGSSNGGASGMLSLTGGANLTISNDVFSQASTLGLWIDDTTRPTVTNCVFAGNGSYAIEAPVDDLGLITGIGYGPGQTGMRVRGGTVSHDATWQRPDVPVQLLDATTIATGVTVTIAPGTTVEMGPYAYLDVLGTLTARGTDATPIIFTSAAAQPKPGDWQYIRFDGARAVRSVFDHVQVFYGSSNGGASGMLSLTGGANLTISNDVFSQASTLGLWIDDTTRPTVTNCVFAGNGSYAIEAPVDDLGLITGIGYGPGQTGMRVRGGTVSHDATWQRPDVPVQLLDATTIATGVTVTIAPGTTVEMGPYAYLDVLGTLDARGTDATPIIFTSAAAQPKPGDWQYIRFDGARAVRSVFDHVQVFYGSSNGGASGMLSLTGGANLTITNCLVADAAQIGIWVEDGSHPTIAYCSFRDDRGAAISIPAPDPARIHDNTFAAGQAGMDVRTSGASY